LRRAQKEDLGKGEKFAATLFLDEIDALRRFSARLGKYLYSDRYNFDLDGN